jgi:hypothetical protein
LCFFPWTIFAAASFGYLFNKLMDRAAPPFYVFLACWIMVPFVQVQAAHSKLVTYIFPIYPAIAIVTGDFLRELFVGARPKARAFALASLGLVLLLPPAIAAAAFMFPAYVARPKLVCAAMAVFFIVVLGQFLAVRKNVRLFPYAAAGSIVFLFFILLAFDPYADDFLASRHAADYLRAVAVVQDGHGGGPVLCSKMLVRGVRFYSGMETAAVHLGGKKFFSPHPIVFIGSGDALVKYMKGRELVYAVFERKDLEAVREALKGRFECRTLKVFGSQSVVGITPAGGWDRKGQG